MRLLLGTQILLALIDEQPERLGARVAAMLLSTDASLCVSVASLWEIAIKTRLGKLGLSVALDRLPGLITRMGLDLMPIAADYVLTIASPEPATRDPFDRLLQAQCAVEGMRLITIDRALVEHPLARQAD